MQGNPRIGQRLAGPTHVDDHGKVVGGQVLSLVRHVEASHPLHELHGERGCIHRAADSHRLVVLGFRAVVAHDAVFESILDDLQGKGEGGLGAQLQDPRGHGQRNFQRVQVVGQRFSTVKGVGVDLDLAPVDVVFCLFQHVFRGVQAEVIDVLARVEDRNDLRLLFVFAQIPTFAAHTLFFFNLSQQNLWGKKYISTWATGLPRWSHYISPMGPPRTTTLA